MLLHDYEGQMEPPDQLDDPIGFHLWHEANRCPDCNGSGRYLPQSDHEWEIYRAKDGCPTCQGRGVAPHLFDPNF